jgi:hypothetical protein
MLNKANINSYSEKMRVMCRCAFYYARTFSNLDNVKAAEKNRKSASYDCYSGAI